MVLAAFTWSEFAEQVAAGLASGAVYAALALALVLIYRTTGAINFAQGEMATFTTFIAWRLMEAGVGFWAAFPLVLAIAFVGGVALERTLIRPFERAPVLTIVIVTLGLALLLNGLMSQIWGGGDRTFTGGFSTRTVEFAAAVLGGLESPAGAVVGGLALGLVITLLGRYVGYVGQTLKLPVALVLILALLIVRPGGLFGRIAARRV